MRRLTGSPAREPSGVWRIGEDHLERAAAFEALRARAHPVVVTSLSPVPLAQLISAEAATWLDRRLLAPAEQPARAAGFGAEVMAAESGRRRWLLEQGLARDGPTGPLLPPDLITTLRRRELLRVADQLGKEMGRPFGTALPGDRIEGVLRRRVDLLSGRFAIVERSRDFTLVPWRPVLEGRLGTRISGLVRTDGVSWTIGRARSGPGSSE
jgi:hypothetical protein